MTSHVPQILHSRVGGGRHWFTTAELRPLQIWPVAPNHFRAGRLLMRLLVALRTEQGAIERELVLTRALVASLPDAAPSELTEEAAEVPLRLVFQTDPEDHAAQREGPRFLTPRPPSRWTEGYDAWITWAGRSLGLDIPPADLSPDGSVRALAAAQAAFRAKIPRLRLRYLQGLHGLNMGFKIGLPTKSGGREYVWVRPIDWSDPALPRCVLENQPRECPGYELGQTLEVPVDQLADYAIGSERTGLVECGPSQRIAEDYGAVIG